MKVKRSPSTSHTITNQSVHVVFDSLATFTIFNFLAPLKFYTCQILNSFINPLLSICSKFSQIRFPLLLWEKVEIYPFTFQKSRCLQQDLGLSIQTTEKKRSICFLSSLNHTAHQSSKKDFIPSLFLSRSTNDPNTTKL